MENFPSTEVKEKTRIFTAGGKNQKIHEAESLEAAQTWEKELGDTPGYLVNGNDPAINIFGKETGKTVAEEFDNGNLRLNTDETSDSYGTVYADLEE